LGVGSVAAMALSSNVALHFLSPYLSRFLAAALLCSAHAADPAKAPGGLEKQAEISPPLPSKGGSLEAWAAASSADAAGLAVGFCIDRQADSADFAACKQNVMVDSTTCSQECPGCDPHDNFLRYEACMDGSLFKSGCARKTRDRFYNDALRSVQDTMPLAWTKGWTCKDKNMTEDAVFSSFWDTLCKNKGSPACFPKEGAAKKKASASLLHVAGCSSLEHAEGHKIDAFRQWLRSRLPQAAGMPHSAGNCKEAVLLQRVARTQRDASSRGGLKLSIGSAWRSGD